MKLHIIPPHGAKVETGPTGDIIITLPKPGTYGGRTEIIGLFDMHTHEQGDRIERDGSFCTPPYDRVHLSVTRNGRIRISR